VPAPAAPSAAKDEKPVEVTSFDPETAPKDLKKEGSDWMTMFNPNVKRVLDVGLVHTLVHDSYVLVLSLVPVDLVLTGSTETASSAASASLPTARSSLPAATATQLSTTRRLAPRLG